ncbi:hypothetical protein [Longimicrobium sp.]|jgi:hypothetical protein|uniref:hypothetical protein n=1 Tax=Longimicrobium sp. TaxID=2029185 RepID=UPI002EDA78FD
MPGVWWCWQCNTRACGVPWGPPTSELIFEHMDREHPVEADGGGEMKLSTVDTGQAPEVLEADDTVPVEKLAHWLHGEFGGPHSWRSQLEETRQRYRQTARALMSELPELFR